MRHVNGQMQAVCENLSDLRKICVPSPCSGTPKPTTVEPTATHDMSVTTQRAAYCWGVLHELVPPWQPIEVKGPDGKAHYFDDLLTDEEISSAMAKEYGGNGGTLQPLGDSSRPNRLTGTHLRNLRDRLDRYFRYVQKEIFLRGGDRSSRMIMMAAIKNDGAADAKKSIAATPDEMAKCKPKCGTDQHQCVVNCVEASNITLARVLSCQLLPDGLPY